MEWIYDNTNPANLETSIYLIMFTENRSLAGLLIKQFESFANHFRHLNLGITSDYEEVIRYKESLNAIIVNLSHEFESEDFFKVKLKKEGKFQAIFSHTIPRFFHNDIKEVNFFAYQRNLIPYDTYICLNTNVIRSFSLGDINEDIYECEPSLRQIENIFIDLNCLKLSETMDSSQNLPTGLNIDQLCKLLRFACTSKNLSTLYFNSRNFTNDTKIATFGLIIWYLSEGVDEFYALKQLPESFSEFIIDVKNDLGSLIFRLDNVTEQWEVKTLSSKNFYPCTRKDYEKALEGIVDLNLDIL
jgi:hypothetical protein